MGCKLYLNIICPSPAEYATKNIREGLHYEKMHSV